MGQCATACVTDNDCPQDYECQVSPNSPAGACEISDEVVPPGTYPDAPYYPVYGFGLFTSPGLAVNPKWSVLASHLEAVRVFHTADCGRSGGWDNAGGAYIARHYTKTAGSGAPATSSYLTRTVRIYTDQGFKDPLTLAHEFGHLLIQADRDGDHIGYLLNNCMLETLPEMFGRLFARKLLAPGSSTEYIWLDDRSGPSGERTFVNWPSGWPTIGPVGCALDGTAHTEVLGRFFRILVEGPADLTNDGFGEDIGVSFSPVSVSSAAKVYHDAVYAMDVDDWYGELTRGMESSAIAEGVATQVRLALGASGFFSRDSIVSTTAAETGAASYFDAYTAGTSKLFTAWRDAASGTIRVRRQVGAAGVTEDLGMAAAGPPTVAAHGDKLYVGWVKASGTGASCLHWVYYNADGTRSITYSGSDAGVCHISGEVELVSHTGLYAFFVQTGTSDLKYSRCDALPCTGRLTDWKVLASGARVRTLATGVTAGVSGLSVAGSPGYVWLAGRSPANNVIIWKMQFDAAGGEILTTHSFWLGESGSSPTIDVRQGAFGDNRVYVFWRKSSTTDIVTKMGEYPMLPVQTFRSTAARLGVTRGLPVDADRTELLHFSPDGAFSKAVLYGRH
ncbi:MAG: hypothetical protein AMXMBFR64_37300 [Myxococcales bacterium]